MAVKWEHEPFVGYRPVNPISCPRCEDIMSLRISKIWLSNMWQSYKCPSCDRLIRFVPSVIMGDGVDYLKKIHEERGWKSTYVPTDEWQENEKIRQKLNDLGYW